MVTQVSKLSFPRGFFFFFPQKHTIGESTKKETQIQTRNRNDKGDKYSFTLIKITCEHLCSNLAAVFGNFDKDIYYTSFNSPIQKF